jgi:hypothetical protein
VRSPSVCGDDCCTCSIRETTLDLTPLLGLVGALLSGRISSLAAPLVSSSSTSALAALPSAIAIAGDAPTSAAPVARAASLGGVRVVDMRSDSRQDLEKALRHAIEAFVGALRRLYVCAVTSFAQCSSRHVSLTRCCTFKRWQLLTCKCVRAVSCARDLVSGSQTSCVGVVCVFTARNDGICCTTIDRCRCAGVIADKIT